MSVTDDGGRPDIPEEIRMQMGSVAELEGLPD